MKKSKKIIKITKGEKILYTLAIMCVSATILLKIFCGAEVSNLSMTVSRISKKITTAEKKVESLTMKVDELTSFDKVKDIVKEMGLAYNNDNIIVVSE